MNERDKDILSKKATIKKLISDCLDNPKDQELYLGVIKVRKAELKRLLKSKATPKKVKVKVKLPTMEAFFDV